jgi:hypothetical protein
VPLRELSTNGQLVLAAESDAMEAKDARFPAFPEPIELLDRGSSLATVDMQPGNSGGEASDERDESDQRRRDPVPPEPARYLRFRRRVFREDRRSVGHEPVEVFGELTGSRVPILRLRRQAAPEDRPQVGGDATVRDLPSHPIGVGPCDGQTPCSLRGTAGWSLAPGRARSLDFETQGFAENESQGIQVGSPAGQGANDRRSNDRGTGTGSIGERAQSLG